MKENTSGFTQMEKNLKGTNALMTIEMQEHLFIGSSY